jgi:hypothetical protein
MTAEALKEHQEMFIWFKENRPDIITAIENIKALGHPREFVKAFTLSVVMTSSNEMAGLGGAMVVMLIDYIYSLDQLN